MNKDIQKYIDLGFTERHDFKSEYVLLVNLTNLHTVRIYENGMIWINENGDYKTIHPPNRKYKTS